MKSTAKKMDFDLLRYVADKVTAWTGNVFQNRNLTMIESRLTRRLLQLKLSSLEDYANYLKDHEEEEKDYLIALLTTHHTYFFRESTHFDYIREQVLPKIAKEVESRKDKSIQILSMACSKGHEVYSLATYLEFHLKREFPSLDYKITATDIDIKSVEYANNGVYPFEELKRIPMQYLEGNWSRGSGEIASFAKIRPEIKEKCEFYTDNLLDISSRTSSKKYDIILCRNVFLYFDQEKIALASLELTKLLQPNGYLIVGISESLRGISESIVPVGPSVYRYKSGAITAGDTAVASKTTENTNALTAKPLRILCVDDSKTIHNVLGKILTKDSGFEVVGRAMNGEEAAEFLKHNTVDAMTLDIHMPVMTGLEYLQKHFGPAHPPVVVVTSVDRENKDLALKALDLGASDYVEKPSLQNLKEISQELVSKLRYAAQNKSATKPSFDKEFSRSFSIAKPKECLNVIVASLDERDKVKPLALNLISRGVDTAVVWKDLKPGDHATIKALETSWGLTFSPLSEDMAATTSRPISTSTSKLKYSSRLEDVTTYVAKTSLIKRVVTSVLSQAATLFLALDEKFNYQSHVILEEGNGMDASQIKPEWSAFPYTSIEYSIFEYFSKD